MSAFTVLLRVPDGIHAELIDADVAEESDDGKSLDFHKIGPLIDIAKLLAEFDGKAPTSKEEGERAFRRLLDLLSMIHVASFPREDVAGWFRGEKGKLTVTVENGP